jgi:hypothetical protein
MGYPRYAAFGSVINGEPGHSDESVLSVENIRYAVPSDYTSGSEYPTLAKAVERAEEIARTPVREDWAGEGKHPRVFVDRRGFVFYKDGRKADVVLDRIEVFV